MPQAHAIHHTPSLDDAQVQFTLVFACMLALAIALVYFFPDHSGAEPWQPEEVMDTPGT
ncbi:MAG: hypothetical protein P4M13_04360 [Alphaproteobacteria bacterium]|nr:hypothetical protein [Alphaproteobacteria bacterium]